MGRRMAASAAELVDERLPAVPYRQWRATSQRNAGPISTTEDLLGVFYLPGAVNQARRDQPSLRTATPRSPAHRHGHPHLCDSMA